MLKNIYNYYFNNGSKLIKNATIFDNYLLIFYSTTTTTTFTILK